MGTSLNGLTPASTYQGLIKTTDNAAISGTAKYLSDGLGNDSVLALSTSRVGIGTASPSATLNIKSTTSNNSDNLAQVVTNSEFRLQYRADDISSLYIGGLGSERGYLQGVNAAENAGTDISLNPYGGNVGIGTSTPASLLQLGKSSDSGSASTFPSLQVKNTLATQGDGSSTFNFSNLNVSSGNGAVDLVLSTSFAAGTWAPSGQLAVTSNHPLIIKTNNTEVARFLAGGGLTFNGDTAAANALDDYEEGTFTITATPAASGTITLNPSTAHYTKIGRQVTIQAFITLSSTSSPVGTAILLGGLPFTIANTNAAGGAASVVWADATASYAKTGLPAFFLPNQTQIYAPIDASTVATSDELFVNMTYTV